MDILSALDVPEALAALAVPSFGLHPLKGGRKGCWAVTVSRN